MPSCSGADFEVIDQYLSLRDQIDSEDDSYSIASDQKLPQFSASFLGGPDQETSSSLTFPAMEGTGEPWPINFLLTGNEPHPTSTPGPFNPSARTVQTSSYIGGYSGGIVIEASSLAGGVPFPEDPMSSPELYDLDCDKHTTSLYEKDGYGKVEIKTEQLQDFQPLEHGVVDRPNHLEDSCMLREDREDLTTFMIQSLRDDIIRDCKELNISLDPEKWTAGDTVKWVNSVLRKDQSPNGAMANVDPNAQHVFNVPGEMLCRMSLNEFQRYSPYGGFLHQRLEIWRMAMDITSEPMKSQWYPFPHHPHPNHPHHHHHPASYSNHGGNASNVPHGAPMVNEYGRVAPHIPPSISPAPSTDSNCSTLSHSSSSSQGGRGGAHHSSAGFGLSHGPLDDEVFDSAAISRRKTAQPVASHPTPVHLPTPPRGPRAGKQTIHLWQFLRELLDNTESYHDCIKWTDRARGIFKIEDSSKVARLWGRRKNRPAMNYDKLSRSVRQYYKKGIIRKTEHSKRLVYQFCQPYL